MTSARFNSRIMHQAGLSSALAAVALLFTAAQVVGQEPAASELEQPHPPLSEGGADTCLGCHNADDMLVIFRTPHGQQTDPQAPMAQLQCESCHGPGGDHGGRKSPADMHTAVVNFGIDALTLMADQNAVCMGCHDDDVHLAWVGSVHERNETGCIGCHTVHAETDPVALRATQNEVCFDCHEKQRADSMKFSAHPVRSDNALRNADMLCTDCHSPHASVSSGQLSRTTTNELCTSCHAEFRGPVIFDHAPVSEDCTLCHQPHGSIHNAMLKRRAPLLCQSCHSQNGHPSVSFSDASLPGGTPSAMVLGQSCMNCHTQVHGSNHPSGYKLMR